GLPFLPARGPALSSPSSSPGVEPPEGSGVTALAPLNGPTKRAGGSRPNIKPGSGFTEICRAWGDHHRRGGVLVSALAARASGLMVIHCDSVDWFSHRFGPGTERGRTGWQLADLLLGELIDRLTPEHVVVISDHGAAPVQTFIRIHEALYRAGLCSQRPA